MCPRAYAMPPQTSAELLSKSLMTATRILVKAEICSTVNPAASLACANEDLACI